MSKIVREVAEKMVVFSGDIIRESQSALLHGRGDPIGLVSCAAALFTAAAPYAVEAEKEDGALRLAAIEAFRVMLKECSENFERRMVCQEKTS